MNIISEWCSNKAVGMEKWQAGDIWEKYRTRSVLVRSASHWLVELGDRSILAETSLALKMPFLDGSLVLPPSPGHLSSNSCQGSKSFNQIQIQIWKEIQIQTQKEIQNRTKYKLDLLPCFSSNQSVNSHLSSKYRNTKAIKDEIHQEKSQEVWQNYRPYLFCGKEYFGPGPKIYSLSW